MKTTGNKSLYPIGSIVVSIMLHITIVVFLIAIGATSDYGEFGAIRIFISNGEPLTGLEKKEERNKGTNSIKNREETHEVEKRTPPRLIAVHNTGTRRIDAVHVAKKALRGLDSIVAGNTERAGIDVETDEGSDGNPHDDALPHEGLGSPATASVQGRTAGMGDYDGDVYIGAFGMHNGPKFLRKVEPVYPLFARRTGKEGRVLLKLLIDERGELMDIEIVKSGGFGFDASALKAVRMSTFQPAKKDGRLVKSLTNLPIRFVLKDL